MPIYEYRCNNCNCKFDQLRKYEHIDQPLTCPHCGVREYHEVLISSCHFNFVGGMPSYGGDVSRYTEMGEDDE